MEIKPIFKKLKEELFTSRDELLKAWPQFHHDFIYNWAQKSGNFSVLLSDNIFFWLNQNGEYYLDRETFNKVPASFWVNRNFGYIDLILTSEAIKHKAWKVLSYKGLKHVPQFLEDFPDALPIYEKAILDSYTSLYAKYNRLTVSEFLRKRLLWLRIN